MARPRLLKAIASRSGWESSDISMPFPIAAPDQMLLSSGMISRMKLHSDKLVCAEKRELNSTTSRCRYITLE